MTTTHKFLEPGPGELKRSGKEKAITTHHQAVEADPQRKIEIKPPRDYTTATEPWERIIQ